MELRIATQDREIDYIHSLYVRAFPFVEQKPFRDILDLQTRGICDLYIITHEGARCGLAVVHTVKDTALLDYFAIDEKFRGMGLGGMALDALTAHYSDRYFYIEIERIDPASDNNEQRISRRQFYLNHGFVPCDLYARMWGVEMEILAHRRPVTWLQCRRTYCGMYRFHPRSFIKIRPIR